MPRPTGEAATRRVLLHALHACTEDDPVDAPGGELALWLAGRGVRLDIVAAARPETSGWWQVEEREGMRITRCPLRWAPLARGIGHAVQRASFALSSAPVLLARAGARADLVAAIDPPPALLPVLLLAARRAGGRSWAHFSEESDLAAPLLRRFDHVSLAAIDAPARLAAAGIAEPRRVALAPWIDTRSHYPLPAESPWRARLRLAADAIVALYCGRLDDAHRLDLLIAAASRLPPNGAVVFVVCGRGPGWRRIAAATRHLPLYLLPWPPAEARNALLNLADIHLLPAGLAAPDGLFPAKAAALLATGRPVLAAGPAEDVPAVLREAVLPMAATADAFAAAIIRLAAAPAERVSRGVAARRAAQDYHEKQRVLRRLERALALRPAPAEAGM